MMQLLKPLTHMCVAGHMHCLHGVSYRRTDDGMATSVHRGQFGSHRRHTLASLTVHAFSIFVLSLSFFRPTLEPLRTSEHDWTRQINPWHG